MGLLGASPGVSFGVEKTNSGTINFVFEMDNNPNKVEWVFSPGTAFSNHTVAEIDGKNVVILSIVNGAEHGYENSKKVALQSDSEVNRTSQRTGMSNDLKSMGEMGMLKDAEGKSYKATEIKGIAFTYQYKPPGAFDTSLDAKVVIFDALENGEVKQLLGERPLRVDMLPEVDSKNKSDLKVGDQRTISARGGIDTRSALPEAPKGMKWNHVMTLESFPPQDVYELVTEEEAKIRKDDSARQIIKNIAYVLEETKMQFPVSEQKAEILNTLKLYTPETNLSLESQERIAETISKLEINQEGIERLLVIELEAQNNKNSSKRVERSMGGLESARSGKIDARESARRAAKK